MSRVPGDLSYNFSKSEAVCKCGCGYIKIDGHFISCLQMLRDIAGCPIVVTSWCRCKKHNKAVRGEPDSLHIKGLAADIQISGATIYEMFDLAVRTPFDSGGIGIYVDTKHRIGGDNRIHVDLRDNGPARWAYLDGAIVSFEAAWKKVQELQGVTSYFDLTEKGNT